MPQEISAEREEISAERRENSLPAEKRASPPSASPVSLAWLLEATGPLALEGCGAILDERTGEE